MSRTGRSKLALAARSASSTPTRFVQPVQRLPGPQRRMAELDSWVAVLRGPAARSGGGRRDLQLDEAHSHLARGWYQTYLGRRLAQRGAALANLLKAQTEEQVLTSPRRPAATSSTTGRRRWASAARRTRTTFRHYTSSLLGRTGSPDEVGSYVAAAADRGSRWRSSPCRARNTAPTWSLSSTLASPQRAVSRADNTPGQAMIAWSSAAQPELTQPDTSRRWGCRRRGSQCRAE